MCCKRHWCFNFRCCWDCIHHYMVTCHFPLLLSSKLYIAVLRCWFYVHHFHEFIHVANLCSDLCYCISTHFVTAQLLWLWCLSLDNITMLTAVPLVFVKSSQSALAVSDRKVFEDGVISDEKQQESYAFSWVTAWHATLTAATLMWKSLMPILW